MCVSTHVPDNAELLVPHTIPIFVYPVPVDTTKTATLVQHVNPAAQEQDKQLLVLRPPIVDVHKTPVLVPQYKQIPVRLNPGLFNTTRMEPNTTTLAAAMEFNGVVLRSTQ